MPKQHLRQLHIMLIIMMLDDSLTGHRLPVCRQSATDICFVKLTICYTGIYFVSKRRQNKGRVSRRDGVKESFSEGMPDQLQAAS